MVHNCIYYSLSVSIINKKKRFVNMTRSSLQILYFDLYYYQFCNSWSQLPPICCYVPWHAVTHHSCIVWLLSSSV